jgi:hypothetical protein
MNKLVLVIAVAALGAAPVAAAPPTLTLQAAPTVVTYGGTTTLSGTLSSAQAGQSVDVQAQPCGQTAFKKVATVSTTAGGAFSSSVKPTIDTTYRVKAKSASSPSVTVKVGPVLALKKIARGNFRVSVTAAASFVGKYVVFQRLRNAKWVTLKKVTLKSVVTTTAPTQVSSASFRIKLKTRLRVRSILPAAQAGTCYLPAKSKVIRS